jgi:hypothetical protein
MRQFVFPRKFKRCNRHFDSASTVSAGEVLGDAAAAVRCGVCRLAAAETRRKERIHCFAVAAVSAAPQPAAPRPTHASCVLRLLEFSGVFVTFFSVEEIC